VLDLFLFAAATESLQFLTLDRTPGFYDLRLDSLGMLLGFSLFLLVLPLARRFRPPPEGA
jgi:hypothetical protein